MALDPNKWLTKRSNGKYKVKFKLGDGYFQKYLDTTDLKTARLLRDQYRTEIEQEVLLNQGAGGMLGELMAQLNPKTKQHPLLSEYYSTINLRFWANKTSELENKVKIDHFIKNMGDLTLDQITSAIIYDYKVLLRSENKKAGTINRYTAPLRFILRKAQFFGVLEVVPRFDQESEKGTERTKIYAVEESEAILNFFKDSEHINYQRMYHFLILASYLGQRRGDILGLTLSNVSVTFDGRALLTFKASKQSQMMSVPLPEIALASIYALNEMNLGDKRDPQRDPRNDPQEQPLVSLTKGQVQHYWRKMKENLGYTFNDLVNVHTFRHTYVTTLLTKGVPMAHVQKLVGHASLATTQRYEHMGSDILSKALDKIGW